LTTSYFAPIAVKSSGTFTFTYRNHRGLTAQRRAVFSCLIFAASEWHAEPQWLIEGLDLDKGATRLFAMRDMTDVTYDP
jgi:hypothetical protein